jgi:hypothetical protein
MAADVGDLKNVLTNVKVRTTYGPIAVIPMSRPEIAVASPSRFNG